MMKSIVLFFLLFNTTVFANCTMNLYKNILIIDPENLSPLTSVERIIKDSNCSQDQKISLTKNLLQVSGEIRNDYLKNISALTDVTITPDTVKVITGLETLKNRLPSSNNLLWSKTSAFADSNLISSDDLSNIALECNNCNNSGDHQVKLTIPEDGKHPAKIIWLKGTLQKNGKVLISNGNIAGQTILAESDLTPSDAIFQDNKTPFTDIKNIRFYKLIRPLNKGDILYTSDLFPVSVIRPGVPVTVSLSNGALSLSIMAESLQNGNMGEMIRLRNTNNNKIFHAKAVDFNKAIIELCKQEHF